MSYECPECGSQEEPKIISHFPPEIYQCQYCGKRGNIEDFNKKDDDRRPKFTPVPKFPS
ncbi:MAG: hypothetical protein ACFFAO_12365 [Candidatus Hermodarchaeota archaeon]